MDNRPPLPECFEDAFSGKLYDLSMEIDTENGLLLKLCNAGLITVEQQQNIESETDAVSRCSTLLSLLSACDGSLITQFLEALVATNQRHIVDFILGYQTEPDEFVTPEAGDTGETKRFVVSLEDHFTSTLTRVQDLLDPHLVPTSKIGELLVKLKRDYMIPCKRTRIHDELQQVISDILDEGGLSTATVQMMSSWCANLLERGILMVESQPLAAIDISVHCHTVKLLECLWEFYQTGTLRDMFTRYINGLFATTDRKFVVNVHIDNEDYDKALSDLNSLTVSAELEAGLTQPSQSSSKRKWMDGSCDELDQ